MVAGRKIPIIRYVPSIGWVLTSVTEQAKEWFNRFCFLLDNWRGINKKEDESLRGDDSFLKLEKHRTLYR